MTYRIDRNNPPQTSETINFHAPEIKVVTPVNSVEGLFIKKKNLPIVQFRLIFAAGSVYDFTGKRGLANLASVLIDEGAGGMTALELNNRFEMLGASIHIGVDHEFLYLTLLSLEEHFEETMELLGKIIAAPHFDEKEFLREKSKVLTNLARLKDEPDSLADKLFEEQIFGFEIPLGKFETGKIEETSTIANSDVRTFYEQVIVPGILGFSCAGSIEEAKLIELVDKNIKLQKNTGEKYQSGLEREKKRRRLFYTHKEGAAQTEIRVGNIASKRKEKDFFAKSVLNTLLGGQFNSRLNFKLREEKGFTYGITSHFLHKADTGYFNVSTSVQSENTIEALHDIFTELEKVKRDVALEEVEAAKLSMMRKYPSGFETFSQLLSGLTTIFTYDLPLTFFDDYLRNIESVTTEQVIETAQMNISEDDRIIVLVGDKKSFLPQIDRFGFDEIIEADEYGEITDVP